jgi:7TMR-DISM extracellular 2
MPRSLAAAALILCGFAAHAALPAAPLPGERDALALGRYLETLEDPGGKLTLAEVASRSDFVPLGRNVANFGYSYSTHWLRFTLPRDSATMLAPLLALEIRFPSSD